jgi:hypothetical protein
MVAVFGRLNHVWGVGRFEYLPVQLFLPTRQPTDTLGIALDTVTYLSSAPGFKKQLQKAVLVSFLVLFGVEEFVFDHVRDHKNMQAAACTLYHLAISI